MHQKRQGFLIDGESGRKRVENKHQEVFKTCQGVFDKTSRGFLKSS